MKTWTGILLMIILAVATLSVTSTAKTTNESKQQLTINESSSQAVTVEASYIDGMKDTQNNQEMMPAKADDVSVAPENEHVRVYPMNVEGSGYIYNGLVVEVNGMKREFSDWRSEGGSYKPEVHELDLNGDGKKEIVVLYSEGHGTGIYLGQAHILDPESLEEMKLQSLDDIVKEHVHSKVESGSNKIKVEVAVDGIPAKVSTLDKAVGEGAYYNQLQFGRVTYYSVEHGKLVAATSGAYGEGLYAGDLTFAYTYQNGEWKAADLKYSMEVYEEEFYESFD